MRVQLELWHLITLLVTFFGASAGVGKLLLAQTMQHMDARFTALDKAAKDGQQRMAERMDGFEIATHRETENWRRIERDLLQLKAEIPLHYVRREDYIRGQSVIEAKLDSLAGKLENWQLRSVIHGEHQ